MAAKQNKGKSFKPKPGRQASLGKQVSGVSKRTFKPMDCVPVESARERKDRIMGE